MVLHWKDFRLSKGGSKSGGGGGGGGAAASSTTEAPAQRPAPALPNGVEVDKGNGETAYSFETKNGTSVELTFTEESGSRYVAFTVYSGRTETGYDRGSLPAREADTIAIKLMKLMRYEASKAPEGTRYDTSAWVGDNFGSSRALAYQRMGFSRPAGGIAGNSQFGIVRNGKLVPDRQKVKQSDRENGRTAREILANMRSEKSERKREKVENALSLS